MSEKTIKCVVWDLDGTIWHGSLIEGGGTELKEGIRQIIEELDRRGILQSIASKNDYQEAWDRVRHFGLDEYFLYPRINWGAKSQSMHEIAKALNIGLDTFAFVDDTAGERGEVNFGAPEVLTIDAADYRQILRMGRMMPEFITEDSAARRRMYKDEFERKAAESGFVGTSEEFLGTLGMRLRISPVTEKDLRRVEELTLRTSQMNATGYTYSYEELRALIGSKRHVFLAAGLEDRFGDYGKVGLALMEDVGGAYVIKLLIMSCRVMTKGIGSTMLIHLIKRSLRDGKKLAAEYLETDRNRMMYITYKFMGFSEAAEAEAPAGDGSSAGAVAAEAAPTEDGSSADDVAAAPAGDGAASDAGRAGAAAPSGAGAVAAAAAPPAGPGNDACAADGDGPRRVTLVYASGAQREYPEYIEVIEEP
ncbi:MAG: HAD-IIIC family phosphatase [Clostridiales Family XIII bacterium]|jgi:FkbH-like protein|nr:HAD-IIIC family phosphatase [Clostridiales Family XIII bacterium]